MNALKIMTLVFLTSGLVSNVYSIVDPIGQSIEGNISTISTVQISTQRVPTFFEQAKNLTTNTQQIANTLQGVATTFTQSVQGLQPVSDNFCQATHVFTQGSNKIYDTATVVSRTFEKLPEKSAVCLIGACAAATGFALMYKALTNCLLGSTPTQPNALFWRRYPNLIQGTLGSLFCISGLAMVLKSGQIVQKLS